MPTPEDLTTLDQKLAALKGEAPAPKTDALDKLVEELETELAEGGAKAPYRVITDHKLPGLNEQIDLTVSDSPGAGGANHVYNLTLGDANRAPFKVLAIEFQNGPISEAGANGFTNEVLLAVAIDRLRGFQHIRNADGSFDFNSRGKFACRENAIALTHCEDALQWLQKRTRDRMSRGVEGRHIV